MDAKKLIKKIKERGLKNVVSTSVRLASKKVEEEIVGPLTSTMRRGQIAMFHIGRSGSTVLGECLGQNSSIYWDGEIYMPYLDSQKYDPIEVLKRKRSKSGWRYYGFEAKPFHLRNTALEVGGYIDELKKVGVNNFIFLKRENILRKIISGIIANKKNKTHIPKEKNAVLDSINIDTENIYIERKKTKLIDRLRKYENIYSDIKNKLKKENSIFIKYESDIKKSPVKAYKKIVNWLGVKSERVEITKSRTNPFPVNKIVDNFDEIEGCLEGTNYEWMLYS